MARGGKEGHEESALGGKAQANPAREA
jgi:hypothetical protein